jgi:plastocyanin
MLRLRFPLLAAVLLVACSGGGDSGPTNPTPVTPSLSAVAVSGLATVIVGQSVQLTASPRDQNGNSISAVVAWSSSAPAIATVSSSGLVLGVAAGAATITASATAGSATVTGTMPVTVLPGLGIPVLTSIAISGGNTVAVGQTLLLSAAAKDQNGNSIGATITWSSNATGVATVNSGLVAGIAPGTAVITAASGSVSSSTTVTVTGSGGGFPLTVDVNMPGNIFSPFSVDIARGGTVRYVFPSDAHNVIFANVSGKPADILVTTNQTVSRTFSVAGTFPYTCTIHPGMDGQVVVH